MLSQFPPDLAAQADRPDIDVSLPEEPEPGRFRRIQRAVVSTGVFLGATILVAMIFFVPVLVFNLSRIEAFEVAGQLVSATLFAEQLGALFWGTFILALAFTSFVASVLLFAPGLRIRPRSQPRSREDALIHMAVLRLSGPER